MLQTAQVLRTGSFAPSFIPPTPVKASTRKTKLIPSKSGVDRKGDVRLWKLHDEYCREQAKLKKLDTPLARSESDGAGERAHQKWEAQLSVVDAIAERIAASRAYTLDGMLMKIQISGSLFDWVGKSFSGNPYTKHDDLWEKGAKGRFRHPENDLIESLRGDLLRLHARGGSR